MRRPAHGATTGPWLCRPGNGYGRAPGRPGPNGAVRVPTFEVPVLDVLPVLEVPALEVPVFEVPAFDGEIDLTTATTEERSPVTP